MLQFISLPFIGSRLGAESYGEIVYLISLFTLISFPIGNVLNNVRLLNDKEYKENNINGDFNLLLIVAIGIASIVFILFSLQNSSIKVLDVFLIVTIIILSILREYFIVTFRLNLNFKRIVINNIYLSIGYFFGTYIFIVTEYWEFIYILGLILSNLFIFRKTNLIFEGFKKTKLFKKTLKDSLYLYSASLIKNLITQADKLLLFPLLGPKNVAIYYSANIIGKIISMFINPANTVILSYLVKVDRKVKLSLYLIATIIIGSVFYILILFIGPLFLKIFYQSWYVESSALLKYTSAAAIISVIAGLLQPFNIKFNDLRWQLIINATNLIVYILLAVILTNLFGLIGFSIGVLITSIFNLIVQTIIYYMSNK